MKDRKLKDKKNQERRDTVMKGEENRVKGRGKMLIPTIIMGFLALILLFLGLRKGQGEHIAGLKTSVSLLAEILPLLVFAFIVAGMVQVLLPGEIVSKWVGAESGFRGILIGTVAGGLAPGGPYVSLPLAAALLHSGASMGTAVAFVTGWSLWAVARLPMEVGIMGWKFTAVRLASTFLLPPVAGLIAHIFFSGPR